MKNIPGLSKSIYHKELLKQAEKNIRLYRLKKSPAEAESEDFKTYSSMTEGKNSIIESDSPPHY